MILAQVDARHAVLTRECLLPIKDLTARIIVLIQLMCGSSGGIAASTILQLVDCATVICRHRLRRL
jgi:hypothetical protein